jgi:hypothetical protein
MARAVARARRTDVELLRSVPVVCEHVSSTAHESGCTLRRRLPARGRFAALLARLGLVNEHTFELDGVGTDFFQAIDGARDLAAIERLLRERHGFSQVESQRAVIAFTEQLMARGLVAVTPVMSGGSR